MSEPINVVHVEGQVPDFTLTVYLPEKQEFDSIAFADLKAQGKWTILFFYTADFAFV